MAYDSLACCGRRFQGGVPRPGAGKLVSHGSWGPILPPCHAATSAAGKHNKCRKFAVGHAHSEKPSQTCTFDSGLCDRGGKGPHRHPEPNSIAAVGDVDPNPEHTGRHSGSSKALNGLKSGVHHSYCGHGQDEGVGTKPGLTQESLVRASSGSQLSSVSSSEGEGEGSPPAGGGTR